MKYFNLKLLSSLLIVSFHTSVLAESNLTKASLTLVKEGCSSGYTRIFRESCLLRGLDLVKNGNNNITSEFVIETCKDSELDSSLACLQKMIFTFGDDSLRIAANKCIKPKTSITSQYYCLENIVKNSKSNHLESQIGSPCNEKKSASMSSLGQKVESTDESTIKPNINEGSRSVSEAKSILIDKPKIPGSNAKVQ